MKRVRSSRSGNLISMPEGEQGFWPSYADMMSAVALILFFLMLLSYIQNLITGNNLQNTQELLSSTREELALTSEQLDQTTEQVENARLELQTVSTELNTARSTLSSQQKEIEGYTSAISQYLLDMDAYAQEIAGQETLIREQQILIDSQADYLLAANTELSEMRMQMQAIAGLRLSILEQIRDSIVDVMGDSSKVSIGKNGNIILNEGVFFDLGSSEIKPESRPILNQLIQVFSRFLSNSENSQYVDSIVISGHTDSTGTAQENRELSTDRANSVLKYLLEGDNRVLEKYSDFFCAAGYGETRPVETNDTAEGRAANRRIEISMILHDESVMEIVEQYLALQLPNADGLNVSAATQP